MNWVVATAFVTPPCHIDPHTGCISIKRKTHARAPKDFFKHTAMHTGCVGNPNVGDS
jgi:hypothetical protein